MSSSAATVHTADDILRRDLTNLAVDPAPAMRRPASCATPTPGATIHSAGGPDTSNTIEIISVVVLADAWYKGARGGNPSAGSTSPN